MRILLLFFLMSFSAMSPQQAFARSEKIAAVVNEDAISLSDLNDRLKLIAASSDLPQTPEIYQKLSRQVIGSLVDEQIMLQEARRLEIQVLPEEIEKGFSVIAQQNNFTAEQFKKILEQSGINVSTMERQIESQISWSKVVQRKVTPRISISDRDIDNVLVRFSNNKGSKEYFVSEIFLPVEAADQDDDIRQLSQKLRQQVETNPASFTRLAQQFSKSAGSAQGGDIGWVQQDQVDEEIAQVLQTMAVGQVSAPVRSLTGYHILLLRQERQISEDTIPSRDQVMNSLRNQRLERMQRRYLQDLRSTAFIESRV